MSGNSYIYTNLAGTNNITLDASGSGKIEFKTKSKTRAFIDDISGNLDVSFNQLTSVSNIRPAPISRTAPGDASYNFSVVQLAFDASARDILIPNPYFGQLCLLLNSSILQLYNNGSWSKLAGLVLNEVAVSSSVGLTSSTTYLDQNFNSIASPTSTGYTVVKLTCTSNTTNATCTLTPNAALLSTSYLLVGGGGAGSSSNGGGGGGGGVLTGTTSLIQSTSYNVTVGAGGIGTTSTGANNTRGSDGSDTIAFSLTAGGGGAGAALNGTGNGGAGGANGRASNGSGGGGAQNNISTGAGLTGGTGNGTGGTGGVGVASTFSGGGGGAGANGGQPNGGNGVISTILGTSYYFGGGGGGCRSDGNGGNGGLGGGGGGSSAFYSQGTGGGSALNSGANGVDSGGIRFGGNGGKDTGGGGGGAGSGNNANGSAIGSDGGSGIIVIRFLSYT